MYGYGVRQTILYRGGILNDICDGIYHRSGGSIRGDYYGINNPMYFGDNRSDLREVGQGSIFK